MVNEVATMEDRINAKIDLAEAGAIAISDRIGGIAFSNMSELMEFAKMMSVSRGAIPPHLRENPGSCLAVCVQALEWRMSPFAVANKSYFVNDRIAYESQLIHAVVEARAKLKTRLRCSYEGDGVALVCVVKGHFQNEPDPIEYRSPEIGTIKPKNSPLWQTDPRQQLWYYSVRAFARRYCPDVLLGIYSEDELADAQVGPAYAKDVTPKPDVTSRLPGKKERGFSHEHVSKTLGTVDKAVNIEPVDVTANPPQEAGSELTIEATSGDVVTVDIGPVNTEVLAELTAKRNMLDKIDSVADLDSVNEQTVEFLKDNGAENLVGQWNAAYLARKRDLGKLKKAAKR